MPEERQESFLEKFGHVISIVSVAIIATWLVAQEINQRDVTIEVSRQETSRLAEAIDEFQVTTEMLIKKIEDTQSKIVQMDYRLRAVCREVIEVRGENSDPSVCTEFGYFNGQRPFYPPYSPMEYPKKEWPEYPPMLPPKDYKQAKIKR